MSFNLTQEPWIPVVHPDFKVQEISLIELFKTWGNVREIQAENPPTTLAIYRLLLAILHTTHKGPRDKDCWMKIYEDDGQKAVKYLQDNSNRFDLLHPEYPFMQDVALVDVKPVPVYSIHTMSTCKVFSHEHEWSGYSITLAQGSRLLVRLQSFDITSLRAFYAGQRSGKRSAVNTPTMNVANVLIQGSTLKETLLFNLIKYEYDPSKEDFPSWETDNGYAGKPLEDLPRGDIHYLTFPWRRVKLVAENDSVRKIAITMGNSLPGDLTEEQWERGIAYGKDKFHLTKQLWRNAHCFLLSDDKNDRPRVVDWFAKLPSKYKAKYKKALVPLQVIGFRAFKAAPLAWSLEKLSVPSIYITDRDLATRLRRAISIAEDHQWIFSWAANSPYHELAKILNHQPEILAKSLGGESRYWATLDHHFQPFLLELAKDKTVNQTGTTYGSKTLPEWTARVQRAARDAFTKSIQSIRNYEARAKALKKLNSHLATLQEDKEEKGYSD